jgi:DNA-binding NarL/FixJ family response regulator
MTEPISILIADDHPVFRTGLRQIIESESDLSVIAESVNGAEALRDLRGCRPQVAVLDMHMPEMSGLDVVLAAEKEQLPSAIMILTMFDDEFLFDSAMGHGVLGYILKDSASRDIVRGIRTVAVGRYYISPTLTDMAVRNSMATVIPPSAAAILDRLTVTERRVLHSIAENHTSAEIGEQLSISYRTVDRHRENICKKLDLSGPYALLRFALQNRAHL